MKLGHQLLLDAAGLSPEGNSLSADLIKGPVAVSEVKPSAKPHKRGVDAHLSDVAQTLVRHLPGHRNLAGQITVMWNPRLTSTAGCANPKIWQVELNPRLEGFGHSVVNRILRHELAHLVAIFRAGRRRIEAHGPEWREACADLGIPGESRCHTLPLPGRTVHYKYAYRCRGCGTILKRVRPLPRYSACYQCCHAHTHGQYDERFHFDKITMESAVDEEGRWHPPPSGAH
jgi:SprT protein